MPDTTGTFFNGNVYAYSLSDLPGLSGGTAGGAFNLASGATPDSIQIDASGSDPFLANTGSTMTATGTVGGGSFGGGTFNTTNVWQFATEDGSQYWVARIYEPSTGTEAYISNHTLDSTENYTIQVMDTEPQSNTSGNKTIWGDKVRLDQASSPDSPAATPEGYYQMAVWSSTDVTVSGSTVGSTFTLADAAQSGTFTTYDNDGYLNDGGANYTNSVNDTDQIGHATFSHGPDYIPDQNFQAEASYLLLDPSDGSQIEVVEISFGSTYSSEKVYFSTAPLVPGRQYTLLQTKDGTPGGDNANLLDGQEQAFSYDILQPPDCFTAGTLIETGTGLRAIETIRAGDLVMTRDHGLQPVRWIGQREIGAETLRLGSHLRPVRIAAGTLGDKLPAQDLIVSRQHRILIGSRIVKRMFDKDEVLVPAKDLAGIVPGIELQAPVQDVTYLHMMFDRHEIVMANGVATESLLSGPQALKSVSVAALAELYEIFPELRARDHVAIPVRQLVRGGVARSCAKRHVKNRVALSV